ncbi:MAG: hypothetical protein GWN58_62085 [Anaerolineae bacterium]|nr:hypothetical protein [Anaerolineae bacterium]
MRVLTSRCGYAAYVDGTVYFACGAGGCGEALLWADGAYTQFLSVGQNLQAVKAGFVLAWNGQLYSNYSPSSLYTTDVSSSFGVDVLSGTPMYMKSSHRYLYRGTTQIADAQAVFVDSGVAYGGRAIFSRNKSDEIVWVTREQADGGTLHHPRFAVLSTDAFGNWYDRSGDYFDVIGDWLGASGSSGDDGNAVCLAFAY